MALRFTDSLIMGGLLSEGGLDPGNIPGKRVDPVLSDSPLEMLRYGFPPHMFNN